VADRNSQSHNSSAEPDGNDDLRAQVRAYFERESELGLEVIPDPRSLRGALSTRPPMQERAPAMSRQPAPTAEPPTDFAAPQRAVKERPVVEELSDMLVEGAVRTAATLEELRTVLGDCHRCKLCEGRTNIVFGTGNPNAELMFVGEGPGQDEDLQGEPFVGRAGALLTDIITKGMGLARSDVYIANVVKCRPPGNRNPEPDEIVACEPFLHRQIAVIRPRVVVTLGTFASQCLLKNRTPISKLRGHWHDYRGVPVMPTFHPAYLLRNGGDKRLVWSDIKLVMEKLALPIPARKA
jgi:DNA polymerase